MIARHSYRAESLTCTHGTPWLSAVRRGCLWCAADGDEGCAHFQAAVDAGTYDREGYTPAERTARERRERKIAC